jgi:hypothetical protein
MRLLETPYYTLDLDPSAPLVIFRRRDVPYPSGAAIEAEAKRIEQAIAGVGSKGYHLLVDVRPSLPRNDAEFERGIVSIRRQLVRYAHRIVVLVQTATGALQVQRHIRDDGMDARVFHDEHEAMSYLLNPNADGTSSIRPGPGSSVFPPSIPAPSTAPGPGSGSRNPPSGKR